jgi:pyruvate formate lyase activating enzyme
MIGNSPSDLLKKYLTEGIYYQQLPDNRTQCFSCANKCTIKAEQTGICKVRYNLGGTLFVPFNYVSALNKDPIEKKPFFHVKPGSKTLSFGMLGCNFYCSFCQNWQISQIDKDTNSNCKIMPISAKEIVEIALKDNIETITSTYNEPLITSEWSKTIFEEAATYGINGAVVSNGFASTEILKSILPFIKYYKVDLKSFNQENYKKCGGNLQIILDTINLLYKNNIWIEIVTLLIPGYNNSKEEISEIATFIKSISEFIPWHITAFHPNYKMLSYSNTSSANLLEAVEIGKKVGLKYIYTGNLSSLQEYENTYCFECGNLLIERYGYNIRRNIITDNSCPKCKTLIHGRWK